MSEVDCPATSARRQNHRGAAKLVLVICALLVVLAFASSAQAATLLRLTPAAGERGTFVRAVGSGFPAGRDGAILFAGARVARVHVNAQGGFSVRFRVPALSRGAKQVVARAGRRSVESVYRITSDPPAERSSITANGAGKRVTLSPIAGPSGTLFDLRARRFTPGAIVQALFDGDELASGTADARGRINFVDLVVPANPVGSHTVLVRSGTAELPMPFRVLASPAPCTPISELPCSEVLVAAPYSLSFAAGAGKLADKDGQGTGFTMVDPPSNGMGYLPANLDLDTAAGSLKVTSTAGLAFTTSDSQDNALGVGIDATDEVALLETTLLNPSAGTGQFEQAGLWFGNDEDNYAKVVVVSTSTGPRVQLLIEIAGVQAGSVTQAVALPADVTLRLAADPGDLSIRAWFSTDGNTFSSLGSFTATSAFFSGDPAAVDPAVGTDSFGGVLASHRTGAAPLTYEFDDFSLTAPCLPLSPLQCSEILVAAPYALGFSSDAGEIADKDGLGTGFTMVDPPSNATGYIPSNLDLNTVAGTLSITTTAGLAFTTSDSQDNALGVGIDAASDVSILSTTLLNPPAGTGQFEQAGLWFGKDEDNYAKVVVVSTGTGPRVQFLLEVGGAQANAVTQAITLPATSVALWLRANPVDFSLSASYSVNGGTPVALGSFTADGSFFSQDPAAVDPDVGTDTFGGIFASHRTAASSLIYVFDGFSLTQEAPPGP